MPINIGKSQILFSSQKGSFFVHFCVIFGISKSTARWALANTGLSNSANYTSIYVSGPISREYLINKLFFTYKNYPYFIFGRELKHLRFIRKKKFFASNQVKSMRMRYGLPIWGQRTHSNAQTSFRISKFFTLVVVFNGKTADLHLVITSSSLVDAILNF